ncbi:hypothetical protein DFI02_106224 [Rhizobium sp. PP-F2F-G20b]|nr:hypothetical protein DFI02_106224 [Rhizobium sp. PP-F2F-G20b]
MNKPVNDTPTTTEEIFESYSVSSQEAERIVEQFGADNNELELLLGNKGAPPCPSPNTSDVSESYVLFEI